MVNFANSILVKLLILLRIERNDFMSDDSKLGAGAQVISGSVNSPTETALVVDKKEMRIATVVDEPFLENYQKVSDAYEKDDWFRSFFYELLNMYGCPATTQACETQTDRVMYSWGVLHVTSKIKKYKNLWLPFYKIKDDPEESSMFFARAVYDQTNTHIIPRLPTPEEEEAARKLAGDRPQYKKVYGPVSRKKGGSGNEG